MSLRRMLPFILLNIVVSALTVAAILLWWDSRSPQPEAAATTADSSSASQPDDLTTAPETATQPAVPPTAAPDSAVDAAPVHIVQVGDTLGAISSQYDVSMDDIMAANKIEDPNLLSVGQQLVIPINGVVAPAPDAAIEAEVEADDADATVEANPTPLLEACEGEAIVQITAVDNAGQFESETVQITNSGSCEASLRGWQLQDQAGNIYTFGQVTLFGEGAGIRVHTTSGADSATDLYWGQSEAIWPSGKLVELYDAAGTIQATFQVP